MHDLHHSGYLTMAWVSEILPTGMNAFGALKKSSDGTDLLWMGYLDSEMSLLPDDERIKYPAIHLMNNGEIIAFSEKIANQNYYLHYIRGEQVPEAIFLTYLEQTASFMLGAWEYPIEHPLMVEDGGLVDMDGE